MKELIFNTPKIARWKDKKGVHTTNKVGEGLYIDFYGEQTTLPYTDINSEPDENGAINTTRYPNKAILGEEPCDREHVILAAKLLSQEFVIVDGVIKNKVLVEIYFADKVTSHSKFVITDGEPVLEDILLEHFNIEKE